MLVLIAFPKLSISGTKEGMILWYQSIVPTLLPYMMLTNMLMNTGVLNKISHKKSFFSLNTLVSVFIGFLCGYPMGAYYVAENYKSQNITKNCAYWLLSFVNLCSPAFIIQYIVINNLNTEYIFPMLFSIYGSAIITAIITFPVYYKKNNNIQDVNVTDNNMHSQKESQAIVDAMLQCLKLLGYIILFSVILKMVTAFINTVTIPHIILIGILEITNGIAFTSENINSLDMAAILMAAFASFGSISCIFQTKSVIKDSQLKMLPYIIAKVVQAILSPIIMYVILLLK